MGVYHFQPIFTTLTLALSSATGQFGPNLISALPPLPHCYNHFAQVSCFCKTTVHQCPQRLLYGISHWDESLQLLSHSLPQA
jgi:hypothetical protein